MDIVDFSDMVKANEQEDLARKWETAYWVCSMMSPHLGKNSRVSTQSLMKPFLPKKETIRTNEECREFFEEFYKKRKEVTSDGNDSRVGG